MKLIFEKNEDGEISIKIDGKDFVTKNYIQMINNIKSDEKIEAEFGENVTKEEQDSVNSMLDEINKIKETDADEGEDSGEEVNIDDIPS